ncbi:response regulator [Paenibacillus amylolyticus]|nr:response regulator [Paenibacillus amylolyticus]
MRLLIVDDEVIIRTGLASVIAWHELGIELLQPAASAEEALTRLAEERPHILMTDIRMTGRSGLELAEEGLRLLPELEVIILSGYDDFSYAQQAIHKVLQIICSKQASRKRSSKPYYRPNSESRNVGQRGPERASLCGRIGSGYLPGGSLMVTPLRVISLHFCDLMMEKRQGLVALIMNRFSDKSLFFEQRVGIDPRMRYYDLRCRIPWRICYLVPLLM